MSNAQPLNDQGLDILFREARTYNRFQARAVPDSLLQDIYDLMKFGPTSANCCPARIVFVKSPEAKARLKPHLDAGNVDKTMAAPVTAIIGYDLKFYNRLPELFPFADAKSWFDQDEVKARYNAVQSGTLQGAYFMMAARALGLDCGPMNGFNVEGTRKTFFEGTDIVPNLLCNLGYGDPESVFPRAPRLTFEEVCTIV